MLGGIQRRSSDGDDPFSGQPPQSTSGKDINCNVPMTMSGRGSVASDSTASSSWSNQGSSGVTRRKGLKTPKHSTRPISCKDLGHGDCQGWLLRKKKCGPLRAKWVKSWCVLKDSTLYYYNTQDDQQPKGQICLTGLKITPEPEASGRYPFCVQNSINTGIFASDSQEDRCKWLNKVGLAAIGVAMDTTDQPIGGFQPGYDAKSGGEQNASEATGDVTLRRRSSANSSAIQMANRVTNLYTLSTIDEDERRHSTLVTTLREVKRLERMINDKQQQLNIIDQFLEHPFVSSDRLGQFMQEYGYIVNGNS